MDWTTSLFSSGIEHWTPLGQAAALFLATFVLEDAAALGAGLLLGTEGISWPVAFWSCFVGIWMGDAGLYAIARWLGRSWFESSRMKRHSLRVKKSEEWFARRGEWLLVVSRMLPGARLPTYLAAGFLRVPLRRFVSITVIAAFFWTALVLALSRQFGNWLQSYFQLGARSVVGIIGLVVLIIVIGNFLRRILRKTIKERLSIFTERARRWEFWPPWVFYPPVALYCVWLAIKYRGVSLPSAANPGIFTGGLVGESKMDTLEQLMTRNPEFTLAARKIKGITADEKLDALRDAIAELHLELPFILKPDIGQRGAGVKLIRSWEQAAACLAKSTAPMIVQKYSPGPFEVGVFYYRFPGKSRGHIFAITEKAFPDVMGDGVQTVSELIANDPRARLMQKVYLTRHANRLQEVLVKGETLKLVEAGNHAQGCIFWDGMHLWTPELESTIDRIARNLDGFYVGRFDIRYANEDAFRYGLSFDIVELNGASAEATSIYDARNSLWAAYRTLFRQWDLIFAIGAENRRAGHGGTSLWRVFNEWLRFRKMSTFYETAD